MSRIKSWDEIMDKMVDRLSKWKMKTLSIGGRLTILKAVLGSMLFYHMSIFQWCHESLQRMESIRIYYALNRALMCKWVWRFTTQKNLLWTRVIKAIHGEDGKNGSGFKKKLGNGADTYFWEDLWHGDMVLKQRYPRLYALEVKKNVDVASKLSQENLTWSFRRAPRSGWNKVVWTLDGSGEFSVASARKVIDDNRFPEVSTQTRWIKAVPIKVNIHAWKVRMDCLPTRLNISRRGIDIPSILCPVYGSVTESSSHLFFDCLVAKDNFRKICRWWEVDFMEVHTFDEWVSWIVNLRIPIKHKSRFMQEPREQHMKAIRQVLRYVKGTKDYGITYKHNGGNKIHGFSDSSYGVNTQEGKGTTGIIFYYGESPISWSTQKQATVALSSCESEFIAATAAATQALWLKRLLSKITHSQEEKVTIMVDNKSAIALMKNPVFHGRSKHIDTKYHFIRECVEREDIQVEFVSGEYQKADILTKALPKIKYIEFKNGKRVQVSQSSNIQLLKSRLRWRWILDDEKSRLEPIKEEEKAPEEGGIGDMAAATFVCKCSVSKGVWLLLLQHSWETPFNCKADAQSFWTHNKNTKDNSLPSVH
ncbi:ribonuclease H-like domain, reverse transcriptase, RNA-dependent DNA polymerase [Tanacetum coccineum]